MDRLSGKVAIVTGAASGIGLGTAKLMAEEGAKVVATDLQFEDLKKGVKEITEKGGTAVALEHDVSKVEDWHKVINETLETFEKIDILVNNAGIFVPKGILETDLELWNKIIRVNATSQFLGMKAVIPHMQQNGKGSIINISSIAALLGGDADGGGAAYSASKGAVRSITKHAAQRFAKDQIRVNSIHPGAIYTGMVESENYSYEDAARDMKANVPLSPYIGEPKDIAYGALYLASDESRYVTGIELVIDGGWTTH